MDERNIKLIEMRVRRGFTQMKFCKKMKEIYDEDIGQDTLSKYENNKIKPRTQRAKNMAELLKCKVEDIF